MAWGDAKERQAIRRLEKLEKVREQVASGELVVRQMTLAERQHWAGHDARATPEEVARKQAARTRRDERRREVEEGLSQQG